MKEGALRYEGELWCQSRYAKFLTKYMATLIGKAHLPETQCIRYMLCYGTDSTYKDVKGR